MTRVLEPFEQRHLALVRSAESDAAGGGELHGVAQQVDEDLREPPLIGTDERRMHVRAYNYWASLLDGLFINIGHGSTG